MNTSSQKPARETETAFEASTPGDAYPDIPADDSGAPGNVDLQRKNEASLVNPLPGEANDGGESILEGRPRETGGDRPLDHIPKT